MPQRYIHLQHIVKFYIRKSMFFNNSLTKLLIDNGLRILTYCNILCIFVL